MSNKTCKTCALYTEEQGGCVRTQTRVRPTDSCSYWTDELMTCGVCGQMFIPPANYIMEENSNEVVIACHNCFAHRGGCQTCQHSYCAFKDDTTCPLPQMVQMKRQQGNMTQIATVPNPARIEATCMKGCPCFSKEGCNKQCGTCGSYCMKGVEQTNEVSEVQEQ